jgi:hypothetical protein
MVAILTLTTHRLNLLKVGSFFFILQELLLQLFDFGSNVNQRLFGTGNFLLHGLGILGNDVVRLLFQFFNGENDPVRFLNVSANFILNGFNKRVFRGRFFGLCVFGSKKGHKSVSSA